MQVTCHDARSHERTIYHDARPHERKKQHEIFYSPNVLRRETTFAFRWQHWILLYCWQLHIDKLEYNGKVRYRDKMLTRTPTILRNMSIVNHINIKPLLLITGLFFRIWLQQTCYVGRIAVIVQIMTLVLTRDSIRNLRGRNSGQLQAVVTEKVRGFLPHVNLNCGIVSENRGGKGGTAGWGTALQAVRSRVQFPMLSLKVFIDIILPATLWPWGRLCSARNEYEEFPVG
jgi:hypothetical protein